MNTIRNFLREDEGATMAEYALLIALIAVVVIAGATELGKHINAVFHKVAHKIHI